MAKGQKERGSWTSFWTVIVFVTAIGIWMTISPKYLLATISAERSFVTQLSGDQADMWVFSKTLSVSADQIKDVSTAIKGTTTTPDAMKGWLQDRIMATWLWGALIVYRVNLLLLFWFILMPLTMAIAADGYSTRMIRTHRFSAQSPIRHRFGVLVGMTVMFGVAFWIVVPVAVPSIVAPAAIALVGMAIWLWVSNLQKRI